MATDTKITRELLEKLYHADGLSQSEMAAVLGCSQSNVYLLMKQFGIKTRSENNTKTNMVGATAGLLTVKRFAYSTSAGTFWHCQCECGNWTVVSRRNLKTRASTGKPGVQSCSCLKGKAHRKGFGDILGMFWNQVSSGAAKRDIDLKLTAEEAFALFQKQGGHCALTGLTITLPKNKRSYVSRKYTASLDRIDSSKPYVKGNVQWVHKTVNMMKQRLTQEEFIRFCQLVANHAETQRCNQES